MTKIKIVFIATAFLLAELPIETMASSNVATGTIVEMAHIGRKRKGYRPKRGGLFNTGLFRKKNACGCPNH